MKQRKQTLPSQIVVEQTAEYKIVFDVHAGDFSAFITDIGPIGIARTKDAARQLVADYTFEDLKRAA